MDRLDLGEWDHLGKKTFLLIPTDPALDVYTYTLELYTVTGEHYLESIVVTITEPAEAPEERLWDGFTGPGSIPFYGASGIALIAVVLALGSNRKLKKLGKAGGPTA